MLCLLCFTMKSTFKLSFFLVFLFVMFTGGSAFCRQDSVPSADEFSELTPATDSVMATDSVKKPVADTLSVSATASVPQKDGGQSLWAIFVAGVVGGLLAFLMPCIFPMVPMTVSFFTKRAETKGKGILGALLYGVSIIVIYVALGLLITLLFGVGGLNELSTNGWFNLFIFLVLMVFGISFLGAFEINLPSSLANSLDSKSDSGGFLGIFFMAATLSVVSFSCTGPIIGSLLFAVDKGEVLAPVVGMLGFSGTLALIFSVFAIFPGWMSGLPKSGGWLNSVKVVLGFIEIALSIKFLSGADLAFHWQFLDREVFLAIWIVISGAIGFYLLGKLKLPHDSPVAFISIPRLFLGLLALAFTIYLIPGMWGAPLRVISGLSPSLGTQDFVLRSPEPGESTSVKPSPSAGTAKKYSELFHKYTPYGIDAFYDYDQGLAYAKSVNKPVFLDFTGEQCVNCRRMEQDVWSNPTVLRLLKEDYVVISLFTDSKIDLPANEIFESALLKTTVNTIGKKFKHLQGSRYSTIAQPYYVLMGHDEKELAPPVGADFDQDNYIRFLQSGITAFKK